MKKIAVVFLLVLSGTFSLFSQNRESALGYYEAGQAAMLQEDWYTAAENFEECLRLNPSHAESTASLAECFYALGEFDQALSWVRKARTLARGNMGLANLEAFILTALGQLDAASLLLTAFLPANLITKKPFLCRRNYLLRGGGQETLFLAIPMRSAVIPMTGGFLFLLPWC